MTLEGLRSTTRGALQYVSFRSIVPFLDYIGKAHRVTAATPLTSHVHPDVLEIVYLETGAQVYQVEGREYELQGGDVFIAYPNEVHGTGQNPEERSDLYWAGVDLGSADSSFFGFGQETDSLRRRLRALPRVLKSSRALGHYFEQILGLSLDYDDTWHLKLHVYVAELLLTILDLASSGTPDSEITHEIRASITYIERHIHERITVASVGERVGLSRCYFQERFRDEVGMTPGQYILREKIKCAQDLLRRTSLSVTDVAYELSFSSSQHFSSTFHSVTGMTPTQYAGSARGKSG